MRVFSVIRVLLATVACSGAGCYLEHEGGLVAPDVVTVSDCALHVDETLTIPLELEEDIPDAEWSFEAATIPDLELVARIVESDGHRRFRWTPTGEHVGRHAIVFTVTSNHLSDEMTVNVEVLP